VDPSTDRPQEFCTACGGKSFRPETDVMDTWATSSMSPQIAAGWLTDPERYNQVFPMSLRPQAHEIIRTWAFYTISKSLNHFNTLPWENVLISGWGIAGEGMGKISKSRGGSIIAPMDMIQKHSADAVRYWAASTSPGKDAIISEEKIQLGSKLITKLWNVAHFVEHFLGGKQSILAHPGLSYTTADLWISSLRIRLIQRVTEAFVAYDYAMAKSEIESFFWKSFTDNYLEMAKQRLYLGSGAAYEAALFTITGIFNTLLKLFAPFLPFVTERIYQNLYAEAETQKSIHQASWPTFDHGEINEEYEKIGYILVEIASTVRRYKSEQNISLGTPIKRLQFATGDWPPLSFLTNAIPDLQSITRAENIVISPEVHPDLIPLYKRDSLTVWILP
jgi:valyl-tRNA synthetase